jgi:hypothetical protein
VLYQWLHPGLHAIGDVVAVSNVVSAVVAVQKYKIFQRKEKFV